MHYEKFNKTVVWRELAHDNRTKVNERSNERIDESRSNQNYNLCPHLNEYKYYKKRVSEVKVQNRKDVNTMCSWVLTAPKDMPASEYRQFFQAGYDFLAKKYGEENVISCWVHMDETTPHMHFKFIPVVKDKKHPDRYKCSAFECVKRSDLQNIHKDISKYMKSIFHRDIGLLNGSTAGGNKTIQELKNQSLIEENEKLQIKLLDAQRIIKEAGMVIPADEVEKIPYRNVPFNKDKAIIDKSQLKDLQQTISQYRSIEKAHEDIQRTERRLEVKEAEIDQKTYILDERERSEKSRVREIIENEINSPKTLDNILKSIEIEDKLKAAERLLKEAGLFGKYRELLEYIGKKKVRTKVYNRDNDHSR